MNSLLVYLQYKDTALHLAAKGIEAICVRALLSHPGIDINLKNSEGRTAMMVAGYKSLGVFNQMVKTSTSFPANSYGKVVLCGHSGSGKSTLTQVNRLMHGLGPGSGTLQYAHFPHVVVP